MTFGDFIYGGLGETLEQWSYNDDDTLVATLGHGLSQDSTNFNTWGLIDL